MKIKQEPITHLVPDITKLQISDSQLVFYDDEDNNCQDKESVSPKAKDQPKVEDHLEHQKMEQSTSMHPLPDSMLQRVDDIDMNEVESSEEEDQDDEEKEEENQSSAVNESSDAKDEGIETGVKGNDGKKMRKKKKNRKIRTTITREKLRLMNQIFVEYVRCKDQNKNPGKNLKQIGTQLGLGYSTILHKFRQFRSTKEVKGGALIASLQKKRKYNKSVIIEKIIGEALDARPFYTAVELSQYIYKTKGRRFSRSIISRHLGEMGYSYKNIKSSPVEKKLKYKETRKVYADIVLPYITSPKTVVLYIDEMACHVAHYLKKRVKFNPKQQDEQNENDYVSLIMGATIEGLSFFHIKIGFYQQDQFLTYLKQSLETIVKVKFAQNIPEEKSIIMITDMKRIHLDPQNLPAEQRPIKSLLQNHCGRRFYLPPASPHLNPLETIFSTIKNKLLKKDIKNIVELKNFMQSCVEEITKGSIVQYFQAVLKQVTALSNDDAESIFCDRTAGSSYEKSQELSNSYD